MLFNSMPFLIFFPVFFLVYFLLQGQLRLLFCLFGSYFFYAWWDWRFVFLILFSTCVNYLFGNIIYMANSKRRKQVYLVVNLIINLGLLLIFKYFYLLFQPLSSFLTKLGYFSDVYAFHVILPVGISFYTFIGLSYVIDIYYDKIQLETSFLRFANFVCIFPHLVAGPIVRADQLLPQFRHDHEFSWSRVMNGMEMVLMGYFLKVVVADSLAPLVDRMWSFPEQDTSLTLLIGVIFFAFQIYCDFNGYSRIAIGLAKMLGFDFGVNFDRPYFSIDFSEFWRRWHISLSTWLRDYLYIPLGGSRSGGVQTARNLVITMLLGGLWHGANWTFVVWGALHAIYLMSQHALSRLFHPLQDRFTFVRTCLKPIRMIVVFVAVCFAWIFFRSPNLEVASKMISGIVKLDNFDVMNVPDKFLVVKGLMLIISLILGEAISKTNKIRETILTHPIFRFTFALMILWSIALLGTFQGMSFIYFQF